MFRQTTFRYLCSLIVFLITPFCSEVNLFAQPTVDGRFSNDKSHYTFLTQEASGRGEIFYNRDGGKLYLLVRVDQNVNDNVFGKTGGPGPDDSSYISSFGWNNHPFSQLILSDHMDITFDCGANTFTWTQDLLYDADGDEDIAEADWLSDPLGRDGSGPGTAPPGLVSASSIQWNLNNAAAFGLPPRPWDITLGGTRTITRHMKSPDPVSGYPDFDHVFEWEWAVIYEMSIDIAACGGDPIFIGVPSAHNSPSKDGVEDVVIPTVLPIVPPIIPPPNPMPPPPIIQAPATQNLLESTLDVSVIQQDPLLIYTVVITNIQAGIDQGDNPGPEFEFVIPRETKLVAHTLEASSGVIEFNAALNRVLWNGAIPAGKHVILHFLIEKRGGFILGDRDRFPASPWITLFALGMIVGSVSLFCSQQRKLISALLLSCVLFATTSCAGIIPAIPIRMEVCGHGIIHYDSNGDGINDAFQLTDDPRTAQIGDPTCVPVLPEIPGIGGY